MISKFLRETQHMRTTSSHRYPWKGQIYSYRLPFAFVIPHELISARSDVGSEYLNLLPTVKEGASFEGPLTGRTYMQPMITYALTATTTRSAAHIGSEIQCRYRREIIVMPSIPAAPPLQVEDFLPEYKTTCGKVLKRHIWSRPLGKLTVSAVEPQPLNISTSAPRASTVASVKLLFEPWGAHTPAARPYEWNVAVKYYLQIRTFYTTQPYTQIPTKKTVETDPLAGMSCSATSPEVRQCNTLSWHLHRLSSAGTIASDTSVIPWTATLTVPVNASKALVPTYLNRLSARRYVLVLHVGFANLHHDPLVLEVPIQIIYDQSQSIVLSRLKMDGQAGDSINHQLLEGLTSMNLGEGQDQVSSLHEAVQPPSYDES